MVADHVAVICGAAAALVGVSCGVLALAAYAPQDPMFSEAQSYERFMGRWSRQLAPLLVRFAAVREGDAVLDIGSGTGALTAAVVTVSPSSRVVGIDPATPYVALAQATYGSATVAFEVGDARQLRFADGTFDRTMSLLVVNFIPDAATAVREMARVTRRDGIVAAAVWDYAEGMEMLRVFWDEAIALAPGSDARDERHMPLCRPGEMADLWRAQGLVDVVEEGLTIEQRFASFDDYWAPFLERQGPAGSYVASLTDEERQALASRLRQRLLGSRADGVIVLRARAWAVRGRVP